MNGVNLPDAILGKCGVAVLGVGTILHVVGLATVEWTVFNADSVFKTDSVEIKYGLWKICTSDKCVGIIGNNFEFRDYFEDFDDRATFLQNRSPDVSALKASEACAILGMLASFVATAVAAGRIAMPMLGMSTKYLFPFIPLAASMTSFVFILVAVIVWALRVHTRLVCTYGLDTSIGYSFILCLVAGILINIGGVLGVLDKKA
ncbi:unnamed protein product [Lymnaea stagnalis]|uniref:Claudin n=1 Tax=Lymnaea stagnalis TaxID=6523 RepID=A0AAV2HMS1_LYMST